MNHPPIVFGDTQNVVAVLHLDKQGLYAIANAFSRFDGFSREGWNAIEQFEKQEEDDKDLPGLQIVITMKERRDA